MELHPPKPARIVRLIARDETDGKSRSFTVYGADAEAVIERAKTAFTRDEHADHPDTPSGDERGG